MEDIEKIEYWLREFGMPEDNIENCATQIAQGYGACRYLDGVSAGADAVKEQNIDAAMAEIKKKTKAFTAATKGESAEEILAEMRGEEPASDDLEKEVYEHLWKGRMGTDISKPIYLSYDELLAVARHFANWQREQMMKNVVEVNLDELMDLLEAEKEETGIGLSEYDAGYENGRMKVINSLTEKIKAL